MLDDLRTLVEIESPSLDLEALAASAEAVRGVDRAPLGVGADDHRQPGRTARPLERSVATPKVLSLGHHDTVFPLGSLAARPFTVADGRATGPGVFDMPAGIVQALHGLVALDDLDGVEMLISADEEVGSTRRGADRGAGPGVRRGARARADRRRRRA